MESRIGPMSWVDVGIDLVFVKFLREFLARGYSIKLLAIFIIIIIFCVNELP